MVIDKLFKKLKKKKRKKKGYLTELFNTPLFFSLLYKTCYICIFICKYNKYCYVVIYPILPPRAKCDTRSIFKGSKAGLNLEFSFTYTGCLSKAKELSLPIAERTDWSRPFTRALISFKIKTWVADSIFHDDKVH